MGDDRKPSHPCLVLLASDKFKLSSVEGQKNLVWDSVLDSVGGKYVDLTLEILFIEKKLCRICEGNSQSMRCLILAPLINSNLRDHALAP